MMPRALRVFLLIAVACVGASLGASCSSKDPAAPAPPPPSPAALSFDALYRVMKEHAKQPTPRLVEAVRASYFREFSTANGEAVAQLATADVDLRFRAAQLVSSVTLDAAFVREMRAALSELERRGAAAPRHYLHLSAAWIATRELVEAGDLQRRHPELSFELIPELREPPRSIAGQPSEWKVDPREARLIRAPVDLQPAQVVVVSHPNCHFSQSAAAAIQSDPVLGPIFAAHSRWLAPQDSSFALEAHRRWRREYPSLPTSIAVARAEWPSLPTWNTPTFYFFQRGALVATVTGWAQGGRRAEVAAALEQIGLLPAQL